LLIFSFNKAFSQAVDDKGKKITTIVLDAGHGGRDPGALGKNSREKDITLKTTLKVGRYIEANMPDVKVIYTRTKDVFVELKKRGEIANKNNADLFISIHCNSNPVKSLYGSESYVLGSDENRINRNMKVAMLENAAILLEENSENTYNGFNPNSPESYIVFSLKQNDYKQQQSIMLAQKIQSQFRKRAGRKDRGVHQAGFLVLAGTYMPSVLVELGYLSNITEEKYLMSSTGQTNLASAIYRAIRDYKKEFELENKGKEIPVSIPEAPPKKNTPHDKSIVNAKKESTSNTNTAIERKTQPAPNSGIEYRVQFYTSPKKISLTDKKFSLIPEVDIYYNKGIYKYTSGHFNNEFKALKRKNELKKSGFNGAWIVKMKNGKRYTGNESFNTKISTEKKPAIEYRVQFYTSPKKIPLTDSKFKSLKEVDFYFHNGLYKYTSGHFKTLDEALSAIYKIKNKGFKDAFIVKMKDGKRVR
jgi:N-acetylmuramoyl-L-alanine amidase